MDMLPGETEPSLSLAFFSSTCSRREPREIHGMGFLMGPDILPVSLPSMTNITEGNTKH